MSIFDRGVVALVVVFGMVASITSAAAVELPENDYPTEARADYVFGCMAVNGQTRDALRRCSCSIDKIAELLSYQQYEEAETIMSVVLKGGEQVQILRHPKMKIKVDTLKRAQIEAELLCF